MITVPLDEAYLKWLYHQVGDVRFHNPASTYWSLFRTLYSKEFVWFIPNDDNRVEEGKALRREFLLDHRLSPYDVDRNWLDLNCSFLEMLIALSRRLAFESEGEAHEWFWELLNTLALDAYSDRNGVPEVEVDEILDRVIWRQYLANGVGGLFPLEHPREDQREVEIWYQMNAYLLEHDDL